MEISTSTTANAPPSFVIQPEQSSLGDEWNEIDPEPCDGFRSGEASGDGVMYYRLKNKNKHYLIEMGLMRTIYKQEI